MTVTEDGAAAPVTVARSVCRRLCERGEPSGGISDNKTSHLVNLVLQTSQMRTLSGVAGDSGAYSRLDNGTSNQPPGMQGVHTTPMLLRATSSAAMMWSVAILPF